MKKYTFIFIFIFSLFAQENDGYITIDIQSDSLVIEHISAWRNCAASYIMDIEIVDSTIYLMEIDTSKQWADCYCYFDMGITIEIPFPDCYRLIIQTYNEVEDDTFLVADTCFTIAEVPLLSFSDPECLNDIKTNVKTTEVPLVDHEESDCFDLSESYIYPHSGNEYINLRWTAQSINSIVKPWWRGYISSDTFYVTMDDTSLSTPDLCSRILEARFGPVPQGRYILSFLDGVLGYPSFIIGEEVILEIENNDLILHWNVAELNCCINVQWEGWLEGNIFHVTMTDTGAPCNCICPFELSARFGPFQPGEYILDFQNTDLGLFNFAIIGAKNEKSLTVLTSYQSECYQIVTTDDGAGIPDEFALLYCYPNPFNSTNTIEYFILEKNTISIQVFDITGRLQQLLFHGKLEPGSYSIQWNANHFTSGIYFVVLHGKNLEIRKKILLLK